MRRILARHFFNRSVLEVAPDLLGKFLVRKYRGQEYVSMIVETEAYGAAHDLASHARSGKTPRNTPMFDGPGTIYVYFTYGMHWLLNLVVDAKDYPSAVLIRGLEDVTGPARLTKKLRIDRRLNRRALGKVTKLWVEDRGVVIKKGDIKKTPRIGVDYAGVWSKKPYRFVLKK